VEGGTIWDYFFASWASKESVQHFSLMLAVSYLPGSVQLAGSNTIAL